MRTLTSRQSFSPLALAAALLVAFAFLFAWPQPAAAHDSLVESNPAADSTVETLPDTLTLTFSAEVVDGDGATEIAVTDAAGDSVTDGPATVDGAVVTQPLVAQADAGTYKVLWKIVSSDGHVTSEAFEFTVATSTLPTPEPSPSATTEETTAPEPEVTQSAVPLDDPNMESTASFSPAWLIAGAAVLLVVVLVLVLLLRRRKPADSESDAPAER